MNIHRFQIGEKSGVITVAPCQTPGSGNCLDFETRPTYYLSYQAVDEIGKGLAAVVPLTLTLSDANDNPPVFLHESYSATIDEGAFKFDTPLRVQVIKVDIIIHKDYYLKYPRKNYIITALFFLSKI